MSSLLGRLTFTNPERGGVVGIELADTPHGDGRSLWRERYLTIAGRRAYHVGNVCDTCPFLFERLEGANRTVSPKEISEALRRGLSQLDSRLVEDVAAILPAGEFEVTLSKVIPRRVVLGSQDDYFVGERVALWGIDGFWGLPHHPKVAYYRTGALGLGGGAALYEFLVPMVPRGWLREETVARYRERLVAGDRPTALAISVLDVKQPADWPGEPTVTEHWCLTHYLLDGHHKTAAAAETGAPITLLSYLAVPLSLATRDQIARALAAL